MYHLYNSPHFLLQDWVQICRAWSKSDASCDPQTFRIRVCCAICCGQIQIKRQWVGVKTTAAYPSRSAPKWWQSSFTNTTSTWYVGRIRYVSEMNLFSVSHVIYMVSWIYANCYLLSMFSEINYHHSPWNGGILVSDSLSVRPSFGMSHIRMGIWSTWPFDRIF